MLNICLLVASGEKLWDFETQKGTVLYLCLEDSLNRLQNRMDLISKGAPVNIFFTTMANFITNGLEKQMENFITEHSYTKLIAIDTLQRVTK